jgi:hypothetical protein
VGKTLMTDNFPTIDDFKNDVYLKATRYSERQILSLIGRLLDNFELKRGNEYSYSPTQALALSILYLIFKDVNNLITIVYSDLIDESDKEQKEHFERFPFAKTASAFEALTQAYIAYNTPMTPFEVIGGEKYPDHYVEYLRKLYQAAKAEAAANAPKMKPSKAARVKEAKKKLKLVK